MNLSADQAIKAASIAATKFFSNDQSIDQDDLASVAMVRILERDPTTIGTAVHVGREGIMREIKYKRYQNATQTIQLSVVESGDSRVDSLVTEKLTRETVSITDQKYRRYIKTLISRMGPPVEIFGRYGLAYMGSQVSDRLVERFRSSMLIRGHDKTVVECQVITSEIRQLAEVQYVLALLIS